MFFPRVNNCCRDIQSLSCCSFKAIITHKQKIAGAVEVYEIGIVDWVLKLRLRECCSKGLSEDFLRLSSANSIFHVDDKEWNAVSAELASNILILQD